MQVMWSLGLPYYDLGFAGTAMAWVRYVSYCNHLGLSLGVGFGSHCRYEGPSKKYVMRVQAKSTVVSHSLYGSIQNPLPLTVPPQQREHEKEAQY